MAEAGVPSGEGRGSGLSGKVRVRPTGVISGYVYDPADPERRFTVEVRVGAKVVCRKIANRKRPKFAPEGVPSCGFTASPGDFGGAWLDQPITFWVPERDSPLGRRPLPIRHLVRLSSVVATPQGLVAHVSAPSALQRHARLKAELGGRTLRTVTEFSNDELLLHVVAPPAELPSDAEFTLHWASDGTPVAGSPAAVVSATLNQSRNGLFSRWLGAVPEAWTVPDPLLARVRPQSADGILTRGRSASTIAFTVESGHTGLDLLQQEIELSEASPSLEVRLTARAGVAGQIVARLAGPSQEATTVLPVGADWAEMTGLLAINGAVEGPLRLSLAWTGEVPAEIEIARVGYGAPGFIFQPGASEPGEENDQPAVINGDFANWPAGLSFRGERRYLETAKDWFLACKPAMPGVIAELERVPIRQLREGGAPERLFGLALHGTAIGSWLRLEVALDAAALSTGAWSALSLVAGKHNPDNRAAARIDRIYVLRRTRENAEAPSFDETVAILSRGIDVEDAPSRVSRPIDPDVQRLIRLAAEASLRHGNQSLFLAFEFRPAEIGVTIADVRLGEAVATARPRGSQTGYLALEDMSIAKQIDRLRGLRAWASPRLIAAPNPIAAGEGLADARWSWGRNPTSVDIVIPVHNAIEEVVGCLRSIEQRTSLPHRVLLIDDASDMHTKATLEAFARGRPWIELVRAETNVGYTRASNMGLSRSTAEWVVLLNSDTLVTSGWLEGLLDCARSDPSIAAAGALSNAASWQSVPDLRSKRGGWIVNVLPGSVGLDGYAAAVRRLSEHAYPRVPLLNGFCTLFRRAALEEVGFLDESTFPMGYGEENDLCIRLRKQGYSLAVADDVYVYHVKSASFGDERRGQLSKAGTLALRAKHPDVDVDALEIALAECLPLTRLRQALRREFGSVYVQEDDVAESLTTEASAAA